MKFKIGEKVKCYGFSWETGEGIIVSCENNYYQVKLFKGEKDDLWKNHNDRVWNYTESGLELLKSMPEKINYILSYDTPDRDPIEYFETLSEVEARIEELTRQNGALLDTIQIFEVQAVGKVEGIKVNIVFEK